MIFSTFLILGDLASGAYKVREMNFTYHYGKARAKEKSIDVCMFYYPKLNKQTFRRGINANRNSTKLAICGERDHLKYDRSLVKQT